MDLTVSMLVVLGVALDKLSMYCWIALTVGVTVIVFLVVYLWRTREVGF